MKIVINKCYGGFGLSEAGLQEYKTRKGITEDIYSGDVERDDPILVQVVEEMGNESWGDFAKLKIVEIPDDVDWQIDEYDGIESIHEVHRIWN